jgi:hypothetical protein
MEQMRQALDNVTPGVSEVVNNGVEKQPCDKI